MNVALIATAAGVGTALTVGIGIKSLDAEASDSDWGAGVAAPFAALYANAGAGILTVASAAALVATRKPALAIPTAIGVGGLIGSEIGARAVGLDFSVTGSWFTDD